MRQLDEDDSDGAFTGSPSKQSQRVVTGLRAVRALEGLLHVDIYSTLSRVISFRSPPRWLTRRLEVTRSEFYGMPLWAMRSANASRSTDRHIVCLHGGGYVHEATIIHWRDYVRMAHDTGATVTVPIYPLVPNGTAATVVPRIADLLSKLVCEHGADTISVYGDSAGGGLALAACQELVRRGATTPDRMVLISPWLDVTMTDPGIGEVDDPALDAAMLKDCGVRWAGEFDTAHPLVSPLFGSLGGLPTTTVYSGSLDVFCVDAIRLRANAVAEGADFAFELRQGLIHDWAISPFPEAVAVRPDIYRQLLHTA